VKLEDLRLQFAFYRDDLPDNHFSSWRGSQTQFNAINAIGLFALCIGNFLSQLDEIGKARFISGERPLFLASGSAFIWRKR
jgi:hypothetical protein